MSYSQMSWCGRQKLWSTNTAQPPTVSSSCSTCKRQLLHSNHVQQPLLPLHPLKCLKTSCADCDHSPRVTLFPGPCYPPDSTWSQQLFILNRFCDFMPYLQVHTEGPSPPIYSQPEIKAKCPPPMPGYPVSCLCIIFLRFPHKPRRVLTCFHGHQECS